MGVRETYIYIYTCISVKAKRCVPDDDSYDGVVICIEDGWYGADCVDSDFGTLTLFSDEQPFCM